MSILIINSGSSSVKFAVIDPDAGTVYLQALAECLGQENASLQIEIEANNFQTTVSLKSGGHAEAIKALIPYLDTIENMTLTGVGHRVVHGASRFSGSMLIDDAIMNTLVECSALAPLHNPPNILGIKESSQFFPDLPQVAVFDTAFHQTMPERAWRYPVPDSWYTDFQVRKYGFHGTSHAFVADQAIQRLGLAEKPSKIITAHLGNGCSTAAVLNGESVDTSMGLTPLEGLVMGTRSGNVDPGLFSYMCDKLDCSHADVTNALNKKSGLLGISGVSNDMRTLQKAANDGDTKAAMAVSIFCYRLAKDIAGMMVALGGVDALVFTGGIGENDKSTRKEVLNLLSFTGLTLDEQLNEQHGDESGRITSTQTPCALVIPTNEELAIARESARIIAHI